jgi:hypothetical protein
MYACMYVCVCVCMYVLGKRYACFVCVTIEIQMFCMCQGMICFVHVVQKTHDWFCAFSTCGLSESSAEMSVHSYAWLCLTMYILTVIVHYTYVCMYVCTETYMYIHVVKYLLEFSDL